MDQFNPPPMVDPSRKTAAIRTLQYQMAESKNILERRGPDGHPDIICQVAIQQAAQILGPDDSYLLDARELHAQILARLYHNDPRSAIEEFREVLHSRISADGPTHPKTAKTRLRLARTMWAIDNYDVEVHNLISSFIRRQEILLETDQDFKMATGVGAYLLLQNKYTEAEQIFRAVLNQGKELSFYNNLQTLEARRKLAETLRHQANSLKAQEDDSLTSIVQAKIKEACSLVQKNVSFLQNDGHRNAQDFQKNWDLLLQCQDDLNTIQFQHGNPPKTASLPPIISSPRSAGFGAAASVTSRMKSRPISGGIPMTTTTSCPPAYGHRHNKTEPSFRQPGHLVPETTVLRTKSSSAIFEEKSHHANPNPSNGDIPAIEFLHAGSQFSSSDPELQIPDMSNREERRSRIGLDQSMPNSQYLKTQNGSSPGPQSVSTESSGINMRETRPRTSSITHLNNSSPTAEITNLSPYSKKPQLGRKRTSDASAASDSSHALREFRRRAVKGITDFFVPMTRDRDMEDQPEPLRVSPSHLPKKAIDRSEAVIVQQSANSPGKFSDSRASTIVIPTLDAKGVVSTKPVKWVLDLKQSEISLSSLSNENAKARAADSWLGRLQSTLKLLEKSSKRRGEDPVRICIIDTGFDGLHPLLFAKPFGRGWGKCLKGCISFDDKQQKFSDGAWVDWSKNVHARGEVPKVTGYSDEDGHGTHCAGLVLEIAPLAEIYIAKVGKGRNHDPDPDFIAQAIDHAADPHGWNVDIISMSFGFEPNIASIEEAINRHSQKIVMFAAAANDGANSDIIAFPARLDNVICIKAGNGDGALSDFSQNNRRDAGDNFFTLGEEVVSIWPSQHLPNGEQLVQKRASGTSVATPIAAAIAALVLEFTRQEDEKTAPRLLEQCARDIAQSPRDRIKRIFRALSESNQNSRGRYVVPWIFLDYGKGRSHAARKIHESLRLPELYSRSSDLGKRTI